ncbi:MAG: hypothetical protein U1E78_01415 [Gammaproteobacteria bacterium]
MIGQVIQKREDLIKDIPLCVPYSDYIHPNYFDIRQRKKNIFVGFGFVSYEDGLSKHVPVDIYTMLLTVEKLRRTGPIDAKVHILIADHAAMECPHPSCADPHDVITKRDKYLKKISHILDNLKVAEHYELHLSSNLIKEDAYGAIMEHLNSNISDTLSGLSANADTIKLLLVEGRYKEANRKYFLEQTAIVRYFFDHQDCCLKVSWTRFHCKRDIRKSMSFDEAHFDRFYLELHALEQERISFVYTNPGRIYNLSDTLQSRVIPYTAAEKVGKARLLLTSKQDIPEMEMVINPKFIESIQEYVKVINELQLDISCGNDADFNTEICFLRNLSRNKMKWPQRAANEVCKELELSDAIERLTI